jgi:TonB family protein
MKVSRSRIAASLAGVFSAALLAAVVAIWFFPITSPAQTVVDDPGITVDAGDGLVHRNPVHYPPGAPASGTVTIEATLDAKGEVSDAHVTSGPDELRKPALSSVLGWHYLTSAGALPTVRISIRFDPPQVATAVPTAKATAIRLGGNVHSPRLVHKTPPVYPPDAKQAGIQGTVSLGVRIATDGTVKEVKLNSGDPLLVQAAIDAVKQWVYARTLLNGNPVEVLTEVTVNFTLDQ